MTICEEGGCFLVSALQEAEDLLRGSALFVNLVNVDIVIIEVILLKLSKFTHNMHDESLNKKSTSDPRIPVYL